jgi:hypothetical protein
MPNNKNNGQAGGSSKIGVGGNISKNGSNHSSTTVIINNNPNNKQFIT